MKFIFVIIQIAYQVVFRKEFTILLKQGKARQGKGIEVEDKNE